MVSCRWSQPLSYVSLASCLAALERLAKSVALGNDFMREPIVNMGFSHIIIILDFLRICATAHTYWSFQLKDVFHNSRSYLSNTPGRNRKLSRFNLPHEQRPRVSDYGATHRLQLREFTRIIQSKSSHLTHQVRQLRKMARHGLALLNIKQK